MVIEPDDRPHAPARPDFAKQRLASQLEAELLLYLRQLDHYRGDGDCAYERALGRAYQVLIDQRTRQLAAVLAAGLSDPAMPNKVNTRASNAVDK